MARKFSLSIAQAVCDGVMVLGIVMGCGVRLPVAWDGGQTTAAQAVVTNTGFTNTLFVDAKNINTRIKKVTFGENQQQDDKSKILIKHIRLGRSTKTLPSLYSA